jgi:Rrf2 family protein
MTILAELAPGEFTGAAQLADEIGAPPNYLGKLLKQLAAHGLLASQRGFGGGFRLARPADKISIYDVVEPLERVSKWNGCFLGRPKCREESPCPVHHRWSKIRRQYLRFLKETTIAELASKEA